METEGCEGQRVVLAGWGALGSVQILHNHLMCIGFDSQGGDGLEGGLMRG